MANVGVAVLTYHPGPEVLETLGAVLASGVSADDVVVVDNASPTTSLDPVRAAHRGELLALTENVGYGAAMNRAAASLQSRDVDAYLFLTQETRLVGEALSRLNGHLDCEPRIGLVGPVLARLSAPREVWSAGGRLTRVARKPVHLLSGHDLPECCPGLRSVEWLDGACLLARREAFEQAGGFREDLFLYWEDVSLALAMRRAQWRVCCAGDALALQEPSMTPPYLMTRNRALVLGRWGVVGAATDVARWLARDLVTGAGWRRAQLGIAGIRDALKSARLDRTKALLRP